MILIPVHPATYRESGIPREEGRVNSPDGFQVERQTTKSRHRGVVVALPVNLPDNLKRSLVPPQGLPIPTEPSEATADPDQTAQHAVVRPAIFDDFLRCERSLVRLESVLVPVECLEAMS
jgi:hypothetical protein